MKIEVKSIVEVQRKETKKLPNLSAMDIIYTPENHQKWLDKQSGVNE